jgi:hypothetical protein
MSDGERRLENWRDTGIGSGCLFGGSFNDHGVEMELHDLGNS